MWPDWVNQGCDPGWARDFFFVVPPTADSANAPVEVTVLAAPCEVPVAAFMALAVIWAVILGCFCVLALVLATRARAGPTRVQLLLVPTHDLPLLVLFLGAASDSPWFWAGDPSGAVFILWAIWSAALFLHILSNTGELKKMSHRFIPEDLHPVGRAALDAASPEKLLYALSVFFIVLCFVAWGILMPTALPGSSANPWVTSQSSPSKQLWWTVGCLCHPLTTLCFILIPYTYIMRLLRVVKNARVNMEEALSRHNNQGGEDQIVARTQNIRSIERHLTTSAFQAVFGSVSSQALWIVICDVRIFGPRWYFVFVLGLFGFGFTAAVLTYGVFLPRVVMRGSEKSAASAIRRFFRACVCRRDQTAIQAKTMGSFAGSEAMVLVKRGSGGDFSHLQASTLQVELGDAEVIVDNGQRVSVLSSESLVLSPDDVLLTSVAPFWKARVRMLQHGWILSMPLCALSCFAIVLVTAVALSGLVSRLAILCPFLAIYVLVFFLALEGKQVVERLSHSVWFQWRIFSTVVANLVLIVALLDVRACVAVSNWALQTLVFTGDGLVGSAQQQRLGLAVAALGNVLVIVLFFATGLVMNTSGLVIPVSAVFDYSVSQLVRDMHAAQALLLIFEVAALYRGAHRRRFLHLGVPVSMSVHPMDAEPPPPAHRKRARGAKGTFAGMANSLVVVSDFLVRTPRSQQASSAFNDASQDVRPEEKPNEQEVRVFVNTVELQASDAYIVHLLGYERGRWWFERFASSGTIAANTVAYTLVALLLFTLPALNENLIPWWTPLLAIVSNLTLFASHVLIMSRSVVGLLVRRRQFRASFFFIVIWLMLICLVLRDSRIAIALFMAQVSLVDLLVDAKLTTPGRRRLSRSWEKIACVIYFSVLSAFMVSGVIPSRMEYVNFRQDLSVNSNGTATSFGDEPFVMDLFQSTVDLQVSFVLEKLLSVVVLLWRNRPSTFQVLVAPITPTFVAPGTVSANPAF